MQDAGIRSLLFVPGDNEKMIHKALASPADAVIVDLEDAVMPSRKGYARGLLAELLPAVGRTEKPVVVRVNSFETGMTGADLAAVVPAAPWGVMLPKWQQASDTVRLGHYLEALEAQQVRGTGETRILLVATETAQAVLALGRHGGHSRLWGMLWGGEDLSASLGAASSRDGGGRYSFPFRHARAQCLYAASAWGAAPIDSVHTDLKDLAALESETEDAVRDGFVAKAAIHPAQVEVINRVMTPTDAQLDWSRRVVELLQDEAVARLDGRMIDLAHKRMAERLLQRAAAIAGRADA